MAITITHALDELQLNELIDDGYTTLKLYKSNTPDGVYSDSSVTPSPSTLAAIVTAGEPFEATFSYSGGNPSMWFKVVAYSVANGISSLNDSEPFHGGGGTTLTTLRQRLGLMMNVMKVGTTTSNGAADGSSAVASSAKLAKYRDDYFGGTTGVDGWFFYDLTQDEWTLVSDWVQSTKTLTLAPVLSSQVVSGTNFELMARWDPDEYREAINYAITNCFPKLHKPVVDTSIVTEEDMFTYQLPNNIRAISKVEIETNIDLDSEEARTRGMPWREIAFDLTTDGLTKTLEFKRELEEGRRLRITGMATLSQLYNNSDYVELLGPQVDLVLYLAAHYLYAKLANNSPTTDVDRYRDQANYYMNMYNENKTQRATRRRSQRMWGHDARWATY